jgi:protein-S-isoprenylcysteine O-methyltransferase Ste14
VPVLISAFVRFVREGVGTPAPVAPTEQLVVGGLYRYVRNPMYLAVLSIIVGQGLLLGHASLFTYAGVVALAFVSFTRLYEEPTLRRQFGQEYETYRRAVPGWWPRLRPFNPDAEHVARTTSRNSPW